MSVGAQMVAVLEAFVEHCVSLVFGHTFECSWFDVSQTELFHGSSPRSSPLVGNQQHSLARWIVHLIVVAHRKIDSRDTACNTSQGQQGGFPHLHLDQPRPGVRQDLSVVKTR
jgi:hypothetical protein